MGKVTKICQKNETYKSNICVSFAKYNNICNLISTLLSIWIKNKKKIDNYNILIHLNILKLIIKHNLLCHVHYLSEFYQMVKKLEQEQLDIHIIWKKLNANLTENMQLSKPHKKDNNFTVYYINPNEKIEKPSYIDNIEISYKYDHIHIILNDYYHKIHFYKLVCGWNSFSRDYKCIIL